MNSIPDLVLNYRGTSFAQELFGFSANHPSRRPFRPEGVCVDRGKVAYIAYILTPLHAMCQPYE